MARTMRQILECQKNCKPGNIPVELIDYYYRIRNQMELTESQKVWSEVSKLNILKKPISEELLEIEFVN